MQIENQLDTTKKLVISLSCKGEQHDLYTLIAKKKKKKNRSNIYYLYSQLPALHIYIATSACIINIILQTYYIIRFSQKKINIVAGSNCCSPLSGTMPKHTLCDLFTISKSKHPIRLHKPTVATRHLHAGTHRPIPIILFFIKILI